jgi:site-specific DNA-methyltransferase (cytosine-N4-specific)
LDNVEPEVRQPFQLLIMSALEPCSLTSKDGQFLRLVKRTPEHPDVAIARAVHEAELDIARAAWLYPFSDGPSSPTVVEGDAQLLEAYPPNPSHALITSPPYPNRYDYTRTYALELCLFFVHNARELRDLRHSLLRSHIEAQERPDEAVPHEAVREVLDHVRRQPLNNPRIPIMLKGYFVDMQRVLQAWSCVMAPGSQVAVVVDNVRFAGEIVPTDLILTDMAARLGFRPEAVWVCRLKGNSSQQMGTYGRVPVRESILLWRRL